MTTGGPAFPQTGARILSAEHETYEFHGMSLRDYFAAQAPPCTVASHPSPEMISDYLRIVSNWNYTYADAMLAERDKS